MFDLNLCKNKSSILTKETIDQIDKGVLNGFYKEFGLIVGSYKHKHLLSSSSIQLQTLLSFREWLPSFLQNKDKLMPLIIDKMVNEKDLYYLSLYNAVYSDSDLIPDVSKFHDEFFKNGGGDHSLALLTGCYWIEHQNSENL